MKARQLGSAATAVLALAATGAAWADQPEGETRVSTKWFLDVSHLDRDLPGAGADSNDTSADLKRFFIDVDHRFSKIWSAHLTTDITWLRNQDPGDLWVRHAYVQGIFSKAFIVRLGAAPMPWQGLVNKWYGYRYVESDLTMRNKVGNVADWGIHTLGELGELGVGGRLEYAASMVTGASYKQPRLGNGPDLSARVSFQPTPHTVVGLGGYRGTLGQDTGGREALHTAQRWSVMAAYADEWWRVGGQYFHASNWHAVVSAQGDHSHGWSAWLSRQLTPSVSLFVRHDHVEPSGQLDPQRRDRYSHAGVEWRARAWLRVAAVWKHMRLTDGSPPLRTDNEAGLWAQVAF